MSSCQIDKLCREWLRENYGEEIASEYTTAFIEGDLRVFEVKRSLLTRIAR